MEPLLCFVFPDNKQILACFFFLCLLIVFFIGWCLYFERINAVVVAKRSVKVYKYLLDLVSNECNVFIINT